MRGDKRRGVSSVVPASWATGETLKRSEGGAEVLRPAFVRGFAGTSSEAVDQTGK